MYTRIVEMTARNGRAKDVCTAINEKVLPILRRQNGFVDVITLVSQIIPNRVLAVSFWNTKEDAEQYQREQFGKLQEAIQHLLETGPTVHTYDVAASTAHKIGISKAA